MYSIPATPSLYTSTHSAGQSGHIIIVITLTALSLNQRQQVHSTPYLVLTSFSTVFNVTTLHLVMTTILALVLLGGTWEVYIWLLMNTTLELITKTGLAKVVCILVVAVIVRTVGRVAQ